MNKVEVDGFRFLVSLYRMRKPGWPLCVGAKQHPLGSDRASILLTHAPDHRKSRRLLVVSLQLSGHTHLGQFIPAGVGWRGGFTGSFVYG